MQRPPDEPNLPNSEGHIVWGEQITLPANLIEGALENVDLQITPEVINVYEDGELLTLKVRFHIAPALRIGENIITYIDLGSFGQNDPYRMWIVASNAERIINSLSYIEEHKEEEQKFTDGKIRLDHLLYGTINTSFFKEPFVKYEGADRFNSVSHEDELPEGIINIIRERIQNNQPLNYQYLLFIIDIFNAYSTQSPLEVLREDIELRAEEEITSSVRHEKEIMKMSRGIHTVAIDEYTSLIELVMDGNIDLYIEFEGTVLLNEDDADDVTNIIFDTTTHPLLTQSTAVNFAYKVIQITRNMLKDQYLVYPMRLNQAGDVLKETLIRRIYQAIKENYPDLVGGFTLGEFASQTYQLLLNNEDPILSHHLRDRVALARQENL